MAALLAVVFMWLAPSALASSQINLMLPQSSAFAILGHDCAGIKEQSFPTGFNLHGYPTGVVDLKTTCSTGGRGSPPHTYTGSAKAVWNFAGGVPSYTSPASAIGPNSPSSDAHGDQLSASGSYAVLIVLAPDAPTLGTAVQSGDQANVTWTPSPSPPWVVPSHGDGDPRELNRAGAHQDRERLEDERAGGTAAALNAVLDHGRQHQPSSLTVTFAGIDDTNSWSVQVRAHNAAGWGPRSAQYILGGA